MTPLITPTELAASLSDNPRIRVLDVQFDLTGPPSDQLYAVSHLPQAPHLSLNDALAGPPGDGGRHPLPDPAVLEAALRRCGINDDSVVVVYDQQTSLSAARAWWILRWAGVSDVRVLDGGMAAWQAAGFAVTDRPAEPQPGSVVVRPGSTRALEVGEVETVARDGILLDSRAPERFRGEVEPIDVVAGHIPGARNAPMSDQLNGDGTFRSPSQLRDYFSGLGVTAHTPIGTTCGSGVTAAHTALALAVAGFEARPYIGSWSHWITDSARPIATGATPPPTGADR